MQPKPRYPDFKPVRLEDQKQITFCFRRSPPVTSELTFTNLFIWRHHYNFQWCLCAETLLIVGHTAEGPLFGLPPVGGGNLSPAFERLFDYLGRHVQRPEIRRAPELLAQKYRGSPPFEVIPDPANSDYVYRTESLINLSGRKYHRKRNHLNQFRNTYGYQYRSLGSDLIEACLDLEEQWCRLRNCAENPGLLSEEMAIREALLHFDKLDCLGGGILVDNKVVAFSLGEELNPDTAVIHLEKANPDFTGSYAVINQEFCQNSWSGYTYTNREQDLGEPGLRQAKLSYYPDHMSNKVILKVS